MSLKARLLASIVALVAATVVVLSVLYLRAVLQNSFEDAVTVAQFNAQQVESFMRSRVQTEVEAMDPPPATLDEWADAFVSSVAADAALSGLLENLVANSSAIVEGLVTGPEDRILAASIGTKRGQRHGPLPPFDEFLAKDLLGRMAEVLSSNQDYEIVRQLGVEDREIFSIRMIVSSVLLRQQVMEPLRDLAWVSFLALLVSVVAAVLVSHVAVRPFEQIAEQIDRITSGKLSERNGSSRRHTKEIAAVESKLQLLGKQFHGARADAQELRSNIDQLLTRLEEAVLLFGPDERLVMAGGAAERLLGGGRWEMMGRSLEQVFPDNSELGAFVQSAVRLRRSAKDRPLMYRIGDDGRPQTVLVSIEVVEDFPTRERVGVLVTLREAEPRKQIESQLDVSTRLAAISRLTSGAAHEIKNPLNSIALHLEVLRTKLSGVDVGSDEIDVIAREIERLDRVVKSFLDFTRPVELKLEDFELRGLVEELASLVKPDAGSQEVEVRVTAPADSPATVRGDRDLLKQALLNVVMNGVQAMPQGGQLDLQLERAGEEWLLRVRDEGHGIPPELRDKIFQLYFTTKQEKGSGIGLAMTFQVVQLHGGTIDFSSQVGRGTEFRIALPPAAGTEGRESAATPGEVVAGSGRTQG